MENYSNKVAEMFLKKFNLKKGECVAVFMDNKPEYVGIMLGLSKIGVISALINVNLKNQQLAHSINVALPKVIVYGNELAKSVEEIRAGLGEHVILISETPVYSSSNDSMSSSSSASGLSQSYALSELLNQFSGEMVTANEPIRTNGEFFFFLTFFERPCKKLD
jgi:acyl-coenzyme A synthetase/AMP-(fatty) acid ligase